MFLFQQYCYGWTGLTAGVTGKSRRVGAKGQAIRSRGVPPGGDEGTRKGGEKESDVGGRDRDH